MKIGDKMSDQAEGWSGTVIGFRHATGIDLKTGDDAAAAIVACETSTIPSWIGQPLTVDIRGATLADDGDGGFTRKR